MSSFKSQEVILNKEQKVIFNFIEDFTNFSHLIPESVNDLKLSRDKCSFSINGMPPIHLLITERIEHKKVSMGSDGGKMPFEMSCHIDFVDNNRSKVCFTFYIELNGMMKMMALDFSSLYLPRMRRGKLQPEPHGHTRAI